MSKYKFYEEVAKSKGKQLLIEETTFSVKPEDIIVFDKPRLIESSGQKFEAIAVLKNVPFTRFVENKNKRTYPKDLWEMVVKSGVGEGSLSLADHPEDDGSVKNIWGVWHDAYLGEKEGYADLYLVEEKPLRVAKAGGRIGISSVGYGSVDSKGVVQKEDFELERFGDFVLNPSQGTTFGIENLNIINMEESTEKQPITEELEVTNKYNKEQNEDKLYMDKLQEKNYKETIKLTLKHAKTLPIREAIETVKEIDDCGVPEVKQLVEATLNEFQNKLEEQKVNAENKLVEMTQKHGELETAHKELTEKYEKAKNVIELVAGNPEMLNESADGLKALYEDAKQVKALYESENFKKIKVENITDINNLVEDTLKRDFDIKVLCEDAKLMKKDIQKYEEEMKRMRKAIQERENQLSKMGFKFEEDEDEDKEDIKEEDDDKKDDEMKEEEGDCEDKEKVKESKNKKKVKEAEDDKKDDEELKEEDDDELKEEDEDDKEEVKESDDNDEDDKMQEDDDKDGDDKLDEEEDEDDKELDEEDGDEDEKKPMTESISKYQIHKPSLKETSKPKAKVVDKKKLTEKEVAKKKMLKEELEKFVEKQIKKNPSMKRIKENLLKSPSMSVAFEMVESFKNSGKEKEVVKLTEKKQNGIVPYRIPR